MGSEKLTWKRSVLKNQGKCHGAREQFKKNEKGYRQKRKNRKLIRNIFFHHTITDKINLFLINGSITNVYFIAITMNDKETYKYDATDSVAFCLIFTLCGKERTSQAGDRVIKR